MMLKIEQGYEVQIVQFCSFNIWVTYSYLDLKLVLYSLKINSKITANSLHF